MKDFNNGGGNGKGPNSQNKKNSKFAKFYKHLLTIRRENLLPCVVFCFSRTDCIDIP